jgi:plastocyanin
MSIRFVLALLTLAAPLAATSAELVVTLKGAKGDLVADAVVSLVPLDRPLPPPAAQTATVEVSQEDEQYQPYLTVVRAGTRVEFPNKDRIQHHIYSASDAKKFEKPLYAPGAREAIVFDQPGVVALGCNIHDWMAAYVVVLDTPWFARSEAAGQASLTGIPPGRYRLEVWHPRLIGADRKPARTPVSRELTLSEGAPLVEAFSLTLAPDRRIRRTPAGKSGKY